MLTSDFRRAAAFVVACAILSACSSGAVSPLAHVAQTSNHSNYSATQEGCTTNERVYPRPSLLGQREHAPGTCAGTAAMMRVRASSNASPRLTTFDAPGAATASACDSITLFFDCGTQAASINDGGTVTGFYLDSDLRGTAFIRTPDGTITTFEAPGSGGAQAGTSATAITNAGTIGGSFLDAQFVSHSFIRTRDGTFYTYDPPFASLIADSPNNQGSELASFNEHAGPFDFNLDSTRNIRFEAAGNWYDASGTRHAYERNKDGSFVDATPGTATSAGICFSDCFSGGTVLGNFTDATFKSFGYERTLAGALTTLDIPNTLFQQYSGLNTRGKITGFYIDLSGVAWGVIQDAHGQMISFQAPDASVTSSGGTEAAEINDAGAVAGIYFDAHVVEHGFYRSPGGQITEFDPVGSIATIPQAINDRGEVAGIWYDSRGQTHSFVWAPR